MEKSGAISELDWNLPDESEVIMAQLLGAYSDIDSMAFAGQGDISSCSFLDNLASCWLDAGNATSSTCSFFNPSSEFQSNELAESNTVRGDSMDYLTLEEQMADSSLMVGAEYQVEDLICSKDGENENEPKEATVLSDHSSEAKRKFLEPENGNSTESPMKKARVQVQKITKNARPKKAAQKNAATGNEALSNASCSSDDESNTSQELAEGASSSAKGKTRAGRGSATDPQSLYARKRRERINERLRVLQNLVPNGTKVDISTMLEEAVQYVKFLQLQIKLLSSEDLWMYAPLAYNGMDIGLDLMIPLPRR